MEESYRVISCPEYKERFGIGQKTDDETTRKEAREKQEKALERAWKTRDFEIDKFWSRSAFFWGFIAVVSGAFAAVKNGAIKIHSSIPYPDFYLILLGIIVSVAWLLVVKGSKFWQKNWETHIDRLEDDITGPLYKTVFTTGKGCFSVSGINEILAWVVIVVWGLLFLNFFLHCGFVQEILEVISPYYDQIIGLLIPVVLTGICIFAMCKYGQSAKGKYKIDKSKYPNGVFVDRGNADDKIE
ncbi:MAG: hypothetical protein LBS57_01305 [Treponema sp.]|jgi:hypothetical protein|nr:hypothetical protein [Treponema sp.]